MGAVSKYCYGRPGESLTNGASGPLKRPGSSHGLVLGLGLVIDEEIDGSVKGVTHFSFRLLAACCFGLLLMLLLLMLLFPMLLLPMLQFLLSLKFLALATSAAAILVIKIRMVWLCISKSHLMPYLVSFSSFMFLPFRLVQHRLLPIPVLPFYRSIFFWINSTLRFKITEVITDHHC